jgi:cold shock CspA family protein
MRGEMLWFNEKKNYGFIMTDDGERLSVLGSGFANGELAEAEGRCARRAVTFQVNDSNGTRQAENVVFERDSPARRARLRGGGIRARG